MATPEEITAQFAATIREIEAQRALEELRTQQANKAAEDLYRRSVGDANHVYDQTGTYIGDQNAAIQQLFVDAISQNQTSNAGLADVLQGISSRNRNDAISEMQRLGVQGAGTGSYLNDAALNEMLSAQSSQNEQANLQLSNTGAVEVGKLLSGMNEGQRGAVLGRVLNTRDDTLRDNNNALALIRQDLASKTASATARRDEMIAAALEAQRQAAARYRGYGGGGYGGNGYAEGKGLSAYISPGSLIPKPGKGEAYGITGAVLNSFARKNATAKSTGTGKGLGALIRR